MDYFFLVFILSIPFWVIGGEKLPLPMNLPASALIFINPAIAASILSYRQSGVTGVKSLIRKAFDAGKVKNKYWYAPALFLVPLIYLLTYLAMRWASLPLPDPVQFPFLLVPVFFVIFLITALGEELGWTGYALDPIQNRWGALAASLILGVVWQVWHIIGDLQAGNPASWIFWHSLYSVALRILIVWIYNNTGRSLFAAALVHAMDNVSWSLFPNFGTGFDPRVACIFAWPVVVLIVWRWGPKTLARDRDEVVSQLEGPTIQ